MSYGSSYGFNLRDCNSNSEILTWKAVRRCTICIPQFEALYLDFL